MAVLPSEQFLIQMIGDDKVILFDRYTDTEEEIVRFDPRKMDEVAKAQKTIHDCALSAEDKAFAHFWCGYFYAHATNVGAPVTVTVIDDLDDFLKGL